MKGNAKLHAKVRQMIEAALDKTERRDDAGAMIFELLNAKRDLSSMSGGRRKAVDPAASIQRLTAAAMLMHDAPEPATPGRLALGDCARACLRLLGVEPPAATSAPQGRQAAPMPGATAQAPRADALPPLELLRISPAAVCLSDLSGRMQCELLPVLQGLEMLSNAVRVLHCLEDAAQADAGLNAMLSRACPDWGDPLANGGDGSATAVVSGLARFAASLGRELSDMADDGGAA